MESYDSNNKDHERKVQIDGEQLGETKNDSNIKFSTRKTMHRKTMHKVD